MCQVKSLLLIIALFCNQEALTRGCNFGYLNISSPDEVVLWPPPWIISPGEAASFRPWGRQVSNHKFSGSLKIEVLEAGLLSGAVLSTLNGDLTEDHSYTGNFMFGGYSVITIKSLISLMPELYYARLGSGFASVGDSKLRLGYLTFPVLILYQPGPDIRLGLGPYLGYLVQARDRGDDYNADVKDLISDFDIGAKAGVYYHVNRMITLGLAFSRGLKNVRDGERVGSFKQYNQSIMLSASVDLSSIFHK